MNLVSLGDRNNNAKSVSVEDTLRAALDGVTSGNRVADRCVVLFLDTRNGAYNIGFQQCGMSVSEMVALIEVMKFKLINEEMGFGRR